MPAGSAARPGRPRRATARTAWTCAASSPAELPEAVRHSRRTTRRRTATGSAAATLKERLGENLEELRKLKPEKLVRRRREKFLKMGQYGE